MKNILLLSIALLSLLAACASDKPMDDETRERLLKDMQGSEAYR